MTSHSRGDAQGDGIGTQERPFSATGSSSKKEARDDDRISMQRNSTEFLEYSLSAARTKTKIGDEDIIVKEKSSGSSTEPPTKLPEEIDRENDEQESQQPRSRMKRVFNWRHWRKIIHFCIALLLISWCIAGSILHRDDMDWGIAVLFTLLVCIRLLTLHTGTQLVTQKVFKPIGEKWNWTSERTVGKIPETWKTPCGFLFAVVIMVVMTFATPATRDNSYADRLLSMAGLAAAVAGLWVTSRYRHRINWRTVIVGLFIQFLLGFFVMRAESGRAAFKFLATLCEKFLSYNKVGMEFMLDADALVTTATYFLVNVAPAIILFIAFVQMISYWGWTQWLVRKFAWFFFQTMRVSGAEAVVAAACPFLGAGETAMLVGPYLRHMTRAEMHQVLTSGFSTVAGSVLYGYVSMGVSGKIVLSSCIMSIPASLAMSKLRYPETEEPLTAGRCDVPREAEEDKPHNALQALGEGTWTGLKVAGIVCAMVLVLLSLVGLVDGLLGWWGAFINLPDLTLAGILGYPLYPVAALCGVSRENIFKVAELIGIKIVANEFQAFGNMMSPGYLDVLTPRSRLIATYALCGFGNIGSVGVSIGVITQLAPDTSRLVASVAISALISGIIATLTSACIAGMLVIDAGSYLDSGTF